MIATLQGTLDYKSPESVILSVNGIGYEVNISISTFDKLPAVGKLVKFYIAESVGMYGGGTTLYGFLTQEEKEIFLAFKDGMKNTGAKKALDYLDKTAKSLPDFKRAVMEKNTKLLTSLFGFRKSTAEKIVALLHDKLSELKIAGSEKFTKFTAQTLSAVEETIQALVAMGYREIHAKHAVEEAVNKLDKIPPTNELLKLALKYI
ncbi:MAG: Holliday junction ATP-dependent DNA helicase RuvA [Elusimicrobiota bacterium]|nr:Holliday junction ATP-dependent DNA helicase RuvA [Elusimicrobiota bacterium]